jgi:hypothetical protein
VIAVIGCVNCGWECWKFKTTPCYTFYQEADDDENWRFCQSQNSIAISSKLQAKTDLIFLLMKQ